MGLFFNILQHTLLFYKVILKIYDALSLGRLETQLCTMALYEWMGPGILMVIYVPPEPTSLHLRQPNDAVV